MLHRRVSVAVLTMATGVVRYSTGLDSTTAFEILLALRVWATGTGATIIATLLQPIPEVYNLFDQVLLLQDGFNVFCGSRSGTASSDSPAMCLRDCMYR
jgi:ABC-type multidrug transport system ATPase subunit